MKKIITALILIIVTYSIYVDLTVGTIPVSSATSEILVKKPQNESTDPNPAEFFTETIKNGDTVLSIVEEHQQGALPVSIEQVIRDFEVLNDGIKPELIQVGQLYKFPYYHHDKR